MLTMLIAGLTQSAALNLVQRAISLDNSSLNYGVQAGTGDWCMFHHDTSHTGSSTLTIQTPLFTQWSNTTNGPIRSSPAVFQTGSPDGDLVFVGSNDKGVHLFSATNGSKMDSTGVKWGRYNFTTNGVVESSPAIADNILFVGSDDNRVYAWNLTAPLFPQPPKTWSYSTNGPVRSSPTIANGMVFVDSDDGYVYALNETNLQPIWQFWTATKVYSSPAFCDGRVFISASDGRVYALNATGRCEWFSNAGANYSSPAVADGMVFVGSLNGTLLSLDENTGLAKWYNTTGGPIESSPAVGNGMVFVGSCDNRTYAFNETTGNQIWDYTTGGPVYSSPAFADGKVFTGSTDGKVYVLNATDGTPLGNYPTRGPIYSSPAIAKNDALNRTCIYIGSDDKQIYCFATENTAPQVTMSYSPSNPSITQTVTFTGTATDPDGDGIASYTWDFGDGTPVLSGTTFSRVTHVYAVAAAYNVNLTVVDAYVPSSGRKANSTWQLVGVSEAWPMYRHDWNHTGNSASSAPIKNITSWNLTMWSDLSTDWIYPSPAVVGNVVYMCSANGTVYAIDATTGSEIWNSTPGGHIHSSPAVAGDMVFIGSDDNEVYALNASDGTLIWSYETYGSVQSSPIVTNGFVYVGGGSFVYVLDEFAPQGNYLAGNTTILKWNYTTLAPVLSSPTVANGMAFFGDNFRKVYAFSATSPWSPKWSYSTGGPVRSSPAFADGMVFVGSDDHFLYALNAMTTNQAGEVKWKFQTQDKIASSPAVADGMVFVGSDDGYVYALNETTESSTGELLWKYFIGDPVRSSPAVCAGKVFIGSSDTLIYAIDERKDETRWSFQTDGPVDSSPAILNGTLYIASKNGTLYAFYSSVHDVAITNVAPSPNVVTQNQNVNISVTVKNQGTYDEPDINVTAYYFNATYTGVVNSTLIPNLSSQGTTSISLSWNTTDTALGTYTISANATIQIDDDPTNNNYADGNIIISGLYNITITNVWAGYEGYPDDMKTCVGQNLTAYLFATVENQGAPATFNVTIKVNTTEIGTTTVDLDYGASSTVNFTWNTTYIYFALGKYTISATAWPVQGNNSKNAPSLVHVGCQGDVNDDRKVDVIDILIVAKNYGATPGSIAPKWNQDADVDNDKKGTVIDILITAKHYGQTSPADP
jgi:outer membrane protein assembly factor BamB